MVLPSTSSVAIGSRNDHIGLPSAPALHSYTCAPSACVDSTTVSPGATSALGSGSAARAVMTSAPVSRKNAKAAFLGIGMVGPLERFQAKWIPVRVKKTRQNKRIEPRSDSIGTEKALALLANNQPRCRPLMPS